MFGQQTKPQPDPATPDDLGNPPRFDQVKGFSALPPKERILAASIYAGFRQALREDREEAEQDRLRRQHAGLTSAEL